MKIMLFTLVIVMVCGTAFGQISARGYGNAIQGALNRAAAQKQAEERATWEGMTLEEREKDIENRAMRKEAEDVASAVDLPKTIGFRIWVVGKDKADDMIARPVRASMMYVWLEPKNENDLKAFEKSVSREDGRYTETMRTYLRTVEGNVLKVHKSCLGRNDLTLLKGLEKRSKKTGSLRR